MVAEKKGLYLGLLLSLFAIGNLMQAKKPYKFLFVNNTEYRLKFVVQYHGRCKLDSKVVESRNIERFKSYKPCEIKKFIVVAYDKYIVPLINIREKNIRAEAQAKKSMMWQFYDMFIAQSKKIPTDEKLPKPELVLSQLFAPGHFTRDKTIIVAVGEPTNLFKVRHWQILPGLREEKFISNFSKGRLRFEKYISFFGWGEDFADVSQADKK